MGVAILTQHVMNACQSYAVLATKRLPERQSASFIKISGQMCSDAFKRRPAFSFTVTILAKKLSATIKTFHYYIIGVRIKPC